MFYAVTNVILLSNLSHLFTVSIAAQITKYKQQYTVSSSHLQAELEGGGEQVSVVVGRVGWRGVPQRVLR